MSCSICMIINICQNSLNCTLKICDLWYVNYVSKMLTKKIKYFGNFKKGSFYG